MNSIRELVRRVLLRMLILTEKGAEMPPRELRSKVSLFKRDIHIPPGLVAVLSALCLYFVLLFAGEPPTAKTALSFAIFVALIIFLFVFYIRHDFPQLIEDDEAIMLLGTLLVFFTALSAALKNWPTLTPLSAGSILCAILLHPRISIVFAMVLASVHGLLHHFSFDSFFLALLGGLAATAAALKIRTHRDFIRAGSTIALVQFLTFLSLALLHSNSDGITLQDALFVVVNGFLSASLALGLLPFLEQLFLRLSPMKLLELANFNQPLLKRLMLEAPGTYHHSLMVATLAEAAGRAIGANELLCRVGAYYHDIGKLVKPEYFIENQGNLPQNPHGNINPTLSALLVVAHVKEGLALAQSSKIPSAVMNFIPMHHGTGRIEYFYQQAKEDAQNELFHENGREDATEKVPEQNYRYPGPKPQTKETAIVMLADSLEAASRTIEDPSHTRFQHLVSELIQAKVRDGQLSNAPLTFADLAKIQESFVNSLSAIYHARIEYPEEESGDDHPSLFFRKNSL